MANLFINTSGKLLADVGKSMSVTTDQSLSQSDIQQIIICYIGQVVIWYRQNYCFIGITVSSQRD